MTDVPSLVAALALALMHVWAGRLHSLAGDTRSAWLSLAGGVSVAYIFVHTLPELNRGQEALRSALPPLRFLEHHVYLVALIGLSVFYGLERAALVSRGGRRGAEREEARADGLFAIHVGAFTLYNGLIGYLLRHREDAGISSLALFAVAMGLHLLVNDVSLREHHQELYIRRGRWVLAAGVLVGWVIGQATAIGEAALAVLFAFLAGGVILNVLKEELPEERESRFWAFAVGAATYSVLLLLL